MKIKSFYSQEKIYLATWNFIFFFENTCPFSQRFQPSITPFEKKKKFYKRNNIQKRKDKNPPLNFLAPLALNFLIYLYNE
jgi:hypothetical protein